MARAIDVANFIILQGLNNNFDINNLKLQKLLYYSEVESLTNRNGVSLFEEDIEKWKLGPVIPQVYHEFKRFGAKPITETVSTINFEELSDDPWNFTFVEFNEDSLNEDERNCVVKTMETLGNANPFHLVDMTHSEPMWAKDKDKIILGEKHLKYDRNEILSYFRRL